VRFGGWKRRGARCGGLPYWYLGLLVLRYTLAKLRAEERNRRGYTLEEQKGIDNFGVDEE
jgi:hypothetical protein